jgi:RimJ/RimL family protein N-acetyltransferase
LPALLVAVADNQQALVRDSEVAGFAFAPAREGSYEDFFARNLQILVNDPARIREMSRRAMELVDGKGATRVRRAMGVTSMNMRPASPADARHIFEWRNHADVRRYSINSESIDWETHRSWFEKTLERPDRVLLIGEASGHPAGVVRFDIDGCTAEISIYKVPGGSALLPGGELLAAAESWLAARHPEVHQLTATVLRENEVSRFLFLSAGYSAEGTRFSKRTRA